MKYIHGGPQLIIECHGRLCVQVIRDVYRGGGTGISPAQRAVIISTEPKFCLDCNEII